MKNENEYYNGENLGKDINSRDILGNDGEEIRYYSPTECDRQMKKKASEIEKSSQQQVDFLIRVFPARNKAVNDSEPLVSFEWHTQTKEFITELVRRELEIAYPDYFKNSNNPQFGVQVINNDDNSIVSACLFTITKKTEIVPVNDTRGNNPIAKYEPQGNSIENEIKEFQNALIKDAFKRVKEVITKQPEENKRELDDLKKEIKEFIKKQEENERRMEEEDKKIQSGEYMIQQQQQQQQQQQNKINIPAILNFILENKDTILPLISLINPSFKLGGQTLGRQAQVAPPPAAPIQQVPQENQNQVLSKILNITNNSSNINNMKKENKNDVGLPKVEDLPILRGMKIKNNPNNNKPIVNIPQEQAIRQTNINDSKFIELTKNMVDLFTIKISSIIPEMMDDSVAEGKIKTEKASEICKKEVIDNFYKIAKELDMDINLLYAQVQKNPMQISKKLIDAIAPDIKSMINKLDISFLSRIEADVTEALKVAKL